MVALFAPYSARGALLLVVHVLHPTLLLTESLDGRLTTSRLHRQRLHNRIPLWCCMVNQRAW